MFIKKIGTKLGFKRQGIATRFVQRLRVVAAEFGRTVYIECLDDSDECKAWANKMIKANMIKRHDTDQNFISLPLTTCDLGTLSQAKVEEYKGVFKKTIPVECWVKPQVEQMLQSPVKMNFPPKDPEQPKRAEKQCFKNAWEEAKVFGGVIVVGVVYQKMGEGVFPIPHAWVERDGVIVESTAGIDGVRVYLGVTVDTTIYEKILSQNKSPYKSPYDKLFLSPPCMAPTNDPFLVLESVGSLQTEEPLKAMVYVSKINSGLVSQLVATKGVPDKNGILKKIVYPNKDKPPNVQLSWDMHPDVERVQLSTFNHAWTIPLKSEKRFGLRPYFTGALSAITNKGGYGYTLKNSVQDSLCMGGDVGLIVCQQDNFDVVYFDTEPSLEMQQKIVEGYITAVYLNDGRTTMMVNEGGIQLDLPPNEEATNLANTKICGRVVVYPTPNEFSI